MTTEVDMQITELPEAQQAPLAALLAEHDGATWELARTVAPVPAVLVSFPEDAVFLGAIVEAGGAVRSRGFGRGPAGKKAKFLHMIQLGSIDPACATCVANYGTEDDPKPDAFCPSHRASRTCRSGGRPHCTCDGCF